MKSLVPQQPVAHSASPAAGLRFASIVMGYCKFREAPALGCPVPWRTLPRGGRLRHAAGDDLRSRMSVQSLAYSEVPPMNSTLSVYSLFACSRSLAIPLSLIFLVA